MLPSIDKVDFQMGSTDFIIEQLNANDLLELINSMPEGYKVIFNMFAIEGYSHNDIATTLGISESTSRGIFRSFRFMNGIPSTYALMRRSASLESMPLETRISPMDCLRRLPSSAAASTSLRDTSPESRINSFSSLSDTCMQNVRT